MIAVISNEQAYKNYLSLFKIDDHQYVIGIFQEGITVYKQQIRALNIFYSLIQTKKINREDKKFHIGIIGGGIAGLTVAAAALKADLRVTLVERESKYLHLQYGCDIRKIHPNLYDYPDSDSLFPYARTPILSWKYDTASNVAKQIVGNFNTITEESQGKFNSITNTKKIETSFIEDGKLNCKIYFPQPNDSSKTSFVDYGFNILIWATGFGVEIGAKMKTPSYWRNDDFGQPILSETKERNLDGTYVPKKFFISGTGDGALIDLFRLKISGFSFDALYQKALQFKDKFYLVERELKKIKDEWNKMESPPEDENWLYKKFREINYDDYKFVFENYLSEKIVKDVDIILNGREPKIQSIFNLKKTSMLNAFLTFIFNQNDLFEYKSGEVILKGHEYLYEGNPIDGVVLIRHGTDRKKLLSEIGLDGDKITELKIRQNDNYLWDKNLPMWSFKDMNSLFGMEIPNVSFFTSETVSIFSTFTAILSNLLVKFYNNQKTCRVTVHRIIIEEKNISTLEANISYQQVTAYFEGYGKTGPIHDIGRTFELSQGSVGLSIMTGQAFLIKNTDKADFEAILTYLNLTQDNIKKALNSSLTIPILATFDNKLSTNLVLFIDSDDVDFFDNDGLMNIIVHSLEGFIESINHLVKNYKIFMSGLEFSPIACNKGYDYQKFLHNKCFENLSESRDIFSAEQTKLKFSTFHSFDVVYRQILEY